METVGYLLAAMTLIYLWEVEKFNILMRKDDSTVVTLRFYRNSFCKYIGTHKPFSCSRCLTVWFAVILFLMFDCNIYYLSLPLFYALIHKQL